MSRCILYIVGVCIILCFQGCILKKKTENYQSKFKYEYDTIFKTYPADFTKRYVGGIDLLTNNNTTYVAYNYCGDNTIKLINLSNDSVIILSQYNPECQETNTRIHDNDIYVITRDNKIYLHCNRETKGELVLDLMSLHMFEQSGLVVDWYKQGGDQHINIPNNTLYFRVNYNYDDSLGVYSKMDFGFPTFAKLNLETQKINFYGARPYFLVHQTFGLTSKYFDLYVGDSIIASNSINGEINVINTLTGKITQKEVKSSFDTVPIKKYSYNNEDDSDRISLKMQHYIESPCYESLFYNPQTNYYYRIFHPSMNKQNENGELNTQYDKQSVLMILNDKFELLDEVLLIPQDRMTIVKLYPTNNGVLISLPALREVTTEKATFSYLKISHFEK